jgi:hypothetical protein
MKGETPVGAWTLGHWSGSSSRRGAVDVGAARGSVGWDRG